MWKSRHPLSGERIHILGGSRKGKNGWRRSQGNGKSAKMSFHVHSENDYEPLQISTNPMMRFWLDLLKDFLSVFRG